MDYFNAHVERFSAGSKCERAQTLLNIVSILAFFSGMSVNDTLVDYDAVHGGKSASDPQTIQVVTIYYQVIAVFCLMVLCLQLPGLSSLKCANGFFISLFAKHMLIDGLQPPPAVMIQTAVVFGLLHFGSPRVGRKAFATQMILSAVVFMLSPVSVLTDSFPDIAGEALTIATLMIEVIAFQSIWLGASALTDGAAKTQGAMWLLNLVVMAKHTLVDGAGPPFAFQVLFAAVGTTYAAEVFGLKLSIKND